MKTRLILVGIFGFILLISPAEKVNSQPLSELNLKAFESLIENVKRAPTNPFSAGVSTASDLAIEDLVLSGIARNESRAYALISGYLVQEGDRIAGFRVDSIEKEQVVLRRLDEVYILAIGGL